tara:strand:+ start:1 stop:2064 length:2064 start_codon:yes stop_codon:yes gene_type:complete
MPFSSGTFSRVHDWTTDRDAGIKISASRTDAEFDGIATALTSTMLKDGSQTLTAMIPFTLGLSVPTDKKLQLRDSDIFLRSSADGQADLVANSVIQLTAPTVNIEASTAITLESDAITLGENGDTDIVLTFNANTADGVITWKEDEDYFLLSDDILMNSTEKIQFGDTASFIQQSSDGVLRIDGEATIDLNASTEVNVSAALTVGGRIITDDTTEATSTTDGSLQTDGGLSVVKDAVFGDDVKLLSDASVIHFGANSEITLTHSADNGLILKHSASGDDKFPTLTLQTGDTDIAVDDSLGRISFQAPDEGTGTDAILVAATIDAISEGDFSSSNNATTLDFQVGASASARAAGDGARLRLTSAGELHLKPVSDTDGNYPIIHLQSPESVIDTNDPLGEIQFSPPDEGSGTDAILVSAAIQARAESGFGSGTNATSLDFKTASSEAAATKMSLTSGGQLLIGTTNSNFDAGADDLIVGNGSGDSGITIYTGSSAGDKGSIFFADAEVGSSAEKKGQISYEQNNEIMTFFTNHTLAMQIDLNGHVTMPKQSAFQARPTSQISNVTDGSSQTLTMATEVFDQNADYDHTNNTFTAPVTGKYLLTLMLRVQSVDTASQYFQTIILTSNKEYQSIFSSNVLSSDPTYWDTIVSVVADMDATDTAIPRVFIESSGAAQVDIATDSYFSGCLLA